MLQTQFWDTSPSTGPSNSWTIHGLWPDHCDGTFDATCDSKRQYTGIGSILQAAGKADLVSYMNQYWVDVNGANDQFWQHEWGKHGTCISTLATSCYSSYTAKQEAVDFFQKTVDLFKALPSYTWLANAGIVPSSSKTYTAAQIQAALKAGFGASVTIGCSSGALNEIWYSYYVTGSVQSGTFVPTNPVGTTSSCSSSGIKYLPKSGSGTPTTTVSSPTSVPTGGGGTFSGSGYLNGIADGSQTGCLISAGTWYTGGTCATFTATSSGDGFTLKSSKGSCGITSGAFSCGSGVTATVFAASGEDLTYSGSTSFYADAVPSGSTQQTVYTSSKSTSVTFQWQSL